VLPPPILYSSRLFENSSALFFHEAGGPPLEALLQILWQHQRLRRTALRTVDGTVLRVLHPGFRNREAGPDFRGAVLKFGDRSPLAGDIEIDRVSEGWKAHGHASNPAFSKVILHVIWEGTGSASTHPTLALHNFLDAPVAELSEWAKSAATLWPEELRGQCCAPLRSLAAGDLNRLLEQAAKARLERKGLEIAMRARAGSWDGVLWEALFRGLGYKKNAWPMQSVAELLPKFELPSDSVLVWQARLLGLSGLLPDELAGQTAQARRYLRQAWDHWWRERDALQNVQLPRSLWTFHGQRPVNHPQRRLALAAHWLASGDLLKKLSVWFKSVDPRERKAALPGGLTAVLQGRPDPYWSRHWTFRSKSFPKPRPLLGVDRASDLAMNAVLPWFWSRARALEKTDEMAKAEALYMAWPKSEDNAVLKLARQRLLGTATDRAFTSAASQQGLLQIVGDFCVQAGSLCVECRFPELARQARAES